MYSKKYLLYTLFTLILLAQYSHILHTAPKEAILVVDVQPGFKEGLKEGENELPVPGCNDEYIDDVKNFIQEGRRRKVSIKCSADQHPKDHSSFTTFHEHCVVNTPGAEALIAEKGDTIYAKGTRKEYESFSAFFIAKDNSLPNGGIATNLRADLEAEKIVHMGVLGVATDICVHASVSDGINHPRPIVSHIPINLCRGLSLKKEVIALREMQAQGNKLYYITDYKKPEGSFGYKRDVFLEANLSNIIKVTKEEFYNLLKTADKKADLAAKKTGEEKRGLLFLLATITAALALRR